MKRALLPLLRPAICTLVLAVPLALGVLAVIENVYQVPLEPESFRFERPLAVVLALGALLVLAARGFLYLRRLPRLRVSRGGDLRALSSGYRLWLSAVLTGMRVLAVACMALALMGPQSIHARNDTDLDGIDIVLTLDLSLSMKAADIKPNRFDATKHVVDDFIGRRPNDRIGAVIFGRDAFTLLPLTTDHTALRTMIRELELDLIDGRGTAIGNAIGVAINRLRKSTAKSRVVILATDGYSNSGNVSPGQAAEFARTLGIKVYTILMGRSGEAPVQTGHDLFGRPVFDRGNFPIDPELLRKVAEQTGGAAFQAQNREDLEQSFHTILDKLERSQIEDAGRIYGELFAAFAVPALGLLIVELLLSALVLRRWP
jgi:Ca-activated chloride channel family protein